jgi:putative membrane protein
MVFGKQVLRIGVAVAVACAIAAPAQAKRAQAKPPSNPRSGIEFLMRSAQGNVGVIRLGELAQKRGQSEGLRSFGEQLVADYGEANKRLAEIGGNLKFGLPREPGPRYQAQYARVSAFSGPAFDRQFLNSILQSQTRTIVDYERATGRKGDAADYAKDMLPVLQKHLRSAERLMRTLRWTGEPRK